jgi:endonuclease YncB( thermonuclease family)
MVLIFYHLRQIVAVLFGYLASICKTYPAIFPLHYDKRDRYGRIVGKVMVASPDACPDASDDCPKTLDAGLAQLTVGLAWWYRRYANEQSEEDRHRYEFAEHEARVRKAGLWRVGNPIPPWEWRRR